MDARCMGGADAFLAFIATDVKPLIESELAIDRGRQALFGHSFGGLFVLHVLFTRPESFQSYVAASPSITWGEPAITAAEARFTADPAHGPIRLLATAGSTSSRSPSTSRTCRRRPRPKPTSASSAGSTRRAYWWSA